MSNETMTDARAIEVVRSEEFQPIDRLGAAIEHLIGRSEEAARLRGEAVQSPSYEALQIIVQSVCGALERAGITDCDDPGEAIDVMRERYEARIAELAAQGEKQAVAWQTRTVSVVTGEIVESWRGCSQKDFDKTGGAPYVWEDVLRIEFRALYECPQPAAVAGDAVLSAIIHEIGQAKMGLGHPHPAHARLKKAMELARDARAALSAAPAAPKTDPTWSLHDRVEFALRDAGFDYDEASRVAIAASAPPAPEHYADDERMCPNCVTPWKCNGPHTLAPAPVAGDAVAIDDAMVERARDAKLPNGERVYQHITSPYELTVLRAALTAALAQDLASQGAGVPDGWTIKQHKCGTVYIEADGYGSTVLPPGVDDANGVEGALLRLLALDLITPKPADQQEVNL